jgi:CDP-4-dehydro-6-deoxyglucose reductase, E3
LRVAAGENVLAVALAAGIPLPHSCRQGRCASCKARLVSGEIAYPDGKLPPGLSADEAAAGAVLLCQARPRSTLLVETRRAVSSLPGAGSEILSVDPLPFDAVRLRLRWVAGAIAARPGQFVDAVNDSGLSARLPVIALRADEIELEAASDGSSFREWLSQPAARGSSLRLKGPFDAPR